MITLSQYENSIQNMEESLESFNEACVEIIANEDNMEKAKKLCEELAKDFDGYDFSEEVQYLDFDEVA